MKTTNLGKNSFAMLLLAGTISLISSCKKDEETAKVTVTSIMADGKELAGAASADKVAADADIVVKFSKAVNAVTAANFTLTPAGGTAASITVTGTGTEITVSPANDLLTGTNYTLTIANSITATDGGKFDGLSITFKTDGLANVVPPQASRQLAYFNFNNNVNSSVGTWTVENVSSSYALDRGGFANSSAAFNGTTDIIEVANGAALFGSSSTLSFWVWSDTTSGHNLFAMGINGNRGSQVEIDGKANWFKNAASFTNPANLELDEDLFFNGDGAFNGNGGWQGTNFNTDLRSTGGVKNVMAMKWAHVVYTYDAATKLRTLYVNGTRMMQADFNLWDSDSKKSITGQKVFTAPSPLLSTKFAFGFAKDRSAEYWSNEPWGNYNNPEANHFKGRLDDVRFFDVALTAFEVSALYNAEK